MLEFAFVLPIVVLMSLGGAELTNYITVKMRISQIALQIADNAARMGNGTATQAKQVTETDINDLFIGAQMESDGLDLRTNGRVILSNLETRVAGATDFKIKWQRCYGLKSYASSYGVTNDIKTAGMGPTGREVKAQDSTPTMFVEIYYVYKPVVSVTIARTLGLTSTASAPTMTQIASMSVRDRRDITGGTNGIYNSAGAPVANC
jgi:Flp pilus assembly protein TadG